MIDLWKDSYKLDTTDEDEFEEDNLEQIEVANRDHFNQNFGGGPANPGQIGAQNQQGPPAPAGIGFGYPPMQNDRYNTAGYYHPANRS